MTALPFLKWGRAAFTISTVGRRWLECVLQLLVRHICDTLCVWLNGSIINQYVQPSEDMDGMGDCGEVAEFRKFARHQQAAGA